jgi:hypothetical protein
MAEIGERRKIFCLPKPGWRKPLILPQPTAGRKISAVAAVTCYEGTLAHSADESRRMNPGG